MRFGDFPKLYGIPDAQDSHGDLYSHRHRDGDRHADEYAERNANPYTGR